VLHISCQVPDSVRIESQSNLGARLENSTLKKEVTNKDKYDLNQFWGEHGQSKEKFKQAPNPPLCFSHEILRLCEKNVQLWYGTAGAFLS